MTQFSMMMQFGCGVTPVMSILMRKNTALAPAKSARIDQLTRERAMSKCADCSIEIPTEQLSGLGTCPNCVGKWVKSYRALHDRRYGKRRK